MIVEKVFPLRLCRKSREKALSELLERRYLTFNVNVSICFCQQRLHVPLLSSVYFKF